MGSIRLPGIAACIPAMLDPVVFQASLCPHVQWRLYSGVHV